MRDTIFSFNLLNLIIVLNRGIIITQIPSQHSATSDNRAGGLGGRGSSPSLPGGAAGFGPIGGSSGGFAGSHASAPNHTPPFSAAPGAPIGSGMNAANQGTSIVA